MKVGKEVGCLWVELEMGSHDQNTFEKFLSINWNIKQKHSDQNQLGKR